MFQFFRIFLFLYCFFSFPSSLLFSSLYQQVNATLTSKPFCVCFFFVFYYFSTTFLTMRKPPTCCVLYTLSFLIATFCLSISTYTITTCSTFTTITTTLLLVLHALNSLICLFICFLALFTRASQR